MFKYAVVSWVLPYLVVSEGIIIAPVCKSFAPMSMVSSSYMLVLPPRQARKSYLKKRLALWCSSSPYHRPLQHGQPLSGEHGTWARGGGAGCGGSRHDQKKTKAYSANPEAKALEPKT